MTPQLTRHRATLEAIAVMLDRDDHPQPVAVAMHVDGWRDQALALAIVRTGRFDERAQVRRIALDMLADQDSRTLVHLMRVRFAEPHLWIAEDCDGRASLACVAYAGHVTRGVGADAGEAVREALGDALSIVQTGHVPQRQHLWLDDPRFGPWPAIDRAVAMVDRPAAGPAVASATFVAIDDRHLAAAGIFAGYAVL